MRKTHETLAAIRASAGLTMAEMAAVLGLKSASAYAYYESPNGYRGDTVPTRLLLKLAEAQRSGEVKFEDAELAEAFAQGAIEITSAHQQTALHRAVMIQAVSLTPTAAEAEEYAALMPVGGMFFDSHLLAEMTEAEAEELLVLEVKNEEGGIDIRLMVDRSVSEVTQPGIYALQSGPTLNLLRAEKQGERWMMTPMEGASSSAKVMHAPLDSYIPAFGQVIWTARSLVHSIIERRSSFTPAPAETESKEKTRRIKKGVQKN